MIDYLLVIETVGAVGFAVSGIWTVRKIVSLKTELMEVSAKHAESFYAKASEFIERDDIPEIALRRISMLSRILWTRRAQFKTIAALRDNSPSTDEDRRQSLASRLPEDARKQWRIVLFDWIVASATQGSVIGMVGALEIVRAFEADKVTPRKESAILGGDLAHASNG
jgi:hypothetical protein